MSGEQIPVPPLTAEEIPAVEARLAKELPNVREPFASMPRALAGNRAYLALVARIEQLHERCEQLAFKAPANSETAFVLLQKAALLEELLAPPQEPT